MTTGPTAKLTRASSSPRTGAEPLEPGQRLGRYEVTRSIGAGGMGVVYQARDTDRGTVVALKTLHHLEPDALTRLKNEFRLVANLTHPNLVSLHELVSVEDQWFFTMEFIDGEDLWMKLRRASQGDSLPSASATQATLTTVSTTEEETFAMSDSLPTAPGVGGPAADGPARAPGPETPRPLLPRAELYRIFQQVALGIDALHSSGKLHCDVKPRNVLVGHDGRVVLLDFGLAKSVAELGAFELSGTPAYLSPERIAGLPPSESSDWYSFGVMLYEALTGRRAFTSERMLAEKALLEPPRLPPSPHVPEELRTLCLALMQRDPAGRPTGREVLARLGHIPPTQQRATARGTGLIGREAHLAALWSAYTTLCQNQTVVVHVHGRSGMGKSALVQRFFAMLGKQSGVTVLSGRCYERESVPYKAFDSLIDALTRHLRTRSAEQMRALTPQHLPELLRIFPVLRQVEAFSRVEPSPMDAGKDRQELRARAFHGIKELLALLGRQTRLVLHIDDLHWGDPDSMLALGQLIDPPDAPRMLLMCGYRTDEGEAAGLLAEHRARSLLLESPPDVREVVLDPLTEEQSREFAAALLQAPVDDPRVLAIAREAHGSPLFLEELALYTRSRDAQGDSPEGTSPEGALGDVTLEKLVLERVAQLPEPVRRLLEVVAVSGRPLAQGVARRAAALEGDPHSPWTLLRSAHLVTTRGAREEDAVECYHDRIRESLYQHLPAPVLAAHHLRLATQLASTGSVEPELLTMHYRAAGVRDLAGHYAVMAAERAASALAFDRAAELFREAMECMPDYPSLAEKRADALVNAGRCAEAAPLYLRTARDVVAERAHELRRRAAEQYLSGGHIPEGVEVLVPVLTELELKYPESPMAALQGIIELSGQLQTGGHRLQTPPPEAERALLVRQAEASWSASKGLGAVDILRGGYFSILGTLLSARAGDARRTARGLACLGTVTTCRGTPADVEAGQFLFAEGERLFGPDDAYLTALFQVTRGTAEMGLGHWRAGERLLSAGNQLLEERCNGVSWECSQARLCAVYSLMQLGELREAESHGTRWLRTAQQTGDLYCSVGMGSHLTTSLLAADQPDTALEHLGSLLTGWSSQQFTPHHLFALVEGARSELYRGRAAAAWKLLDDAWATAEAANAMGWQFNRVLTLYCRATAALALAHEQPAERERLLAVAREDAQRMRNEQRPYARATGAMIAAGLAATEQRLEDALREVDEALARFTEADMAMHAASARRRKGELLGGETGRALIAEADAAMHAQGIRDTRRWTDVHAAGFAPR